MEYRTSPSQSPTAGRSMSMLDPAYARKQAAFDSSRSKSMYSSPSSSPQLRRPSSPLRAPTTPAKADYSLAQSPSLNQTASNAWQIGTAYSDAALQSQGSMPSYAAQQPQLGSMPSQGRRAGALATSRQSSFSPQRTSALVEGPTEARESTLLDETASELLRACQRVTELEADLQRSTADNAGRSQQLQQRVAELEADLQRCTADNATLTQQLQQRGQQQEAAAQDAAAYRARSENQQARALQLEQQLSEARGEAQASAQNRARIAQLQSQLQQAQNAAQEAAEYRARAANLQAQLQAAKADAAGMHGQQVRIAQLQSQLDEAHAEARTLRSQRASLAEAASYVAHERNLEVLHRRNGELEGQLAAAHDARCASFNMYPLGMLGAHVARSNLACEARRQHQRHSLCRPGPCTQLI